MNLMRHEIGLQKDSKVLREPPETVASIKCRHTRESGYPERVKKNWIPVFTGMTRKIGEGKKHNLRQVLRHFRIYHAAVDRDIVAE
jgi:hypothetical protein